MCSKSWTKWPLKISFYSGTDSSPCTPLLRMFFSAFLSNFLQICQSACRPYVKAENESLSSSSHCNENEFAQNWSSHSKSRPLVILLHLWFAACVCQLSRHYFEWSSVAHSNDKICFAQNARWSDKSNFRALLVRNRIELFCPHHFRQWSTWSPDRPGKKGTPQTTVVRRFYPRKHIFHWPIYTGRRPLKRN